MAATGARAASGQASRCAHDLRTPLNAIALAARVLETMLIEVNTNTPQVNQMFKALGCNVHYLETLVSKVIEENTNLETEMGVQLERRKFDLWPLVEALIHDLHPVAGTSTTQLINAIPEDLVIYADAELLKRIFQNLIANAIAYTPRGEVVISAQKTKSGAVECAVKDNGKGMPQDQCAAIFAKHHTDSEKDGGLGLGLAVVLTFVEAHDGTVSAQSEPGVGTTVRFTLPGKAK